MPVAKLEVFENESVRMAAFAKALAHPARICILRHLIGRGEVPCMNIVEALPLSQPACSRHINALRAAGLLKSRNVANKVLYRLDESVLNSFCAVMSKSLHPAQDQED